ncbi:MAG: hypothetical protein D6743_17720, partial [Calditrichaeota bacterium]
MLDSLKRLTKHSAVYGVGHILTRVVGFLLLPLYTNKLPAREFGVAAIIFAFLAVMTPIYTYGLDAAFLRYFILNDDARRRRKIFSTAFWSVFVVALLLSAGIFGLGGWLSGALLTERSYAGLIRIAGLILLFDALAFLPFLYLRAVEKSVVYTTLKFVNVLVNVGLNLYFIVHLGRGVEGIFLANVWASAVTLLLVSFVLVQQVGFTYSVADVKELLKFGLPFLPSVLSVVLLDLIDRPLMEKLAGLEMTGIYNAGVKLGMFMALLVTAFRFAWHPFFLSTSKQSNAPQIFSRVFTYFTLVGSAVFLTVSFFVDEIAQFRLGSFTLIGREYWSGTQVVPLILLAHLLYGMYVNFIVGIYLKNKTRVLPLITLAGVGVNVAANVLLIPRLGMMGAGYARVAGYFVMAGLLYVFAQRFYRIDYEVGRLLKLAG